MKFTIDRVLLILIIAMVLYGGYHAASTARRCRSEGAVVAKLLIPTWGHLGLVCVRIVE